MSRLALGLGLTLAIGLAAGCPTGTGGVGADCTTDNDCYNGGECDRTGECAPAGTLRRVQITWTTPAGCAAIHHFELELIQSYTDKSTNYSPVPCDVGAFTVDRLHPDYDTVEMRAIDDNDNVTSTQTAAIPAGSDVTVTFVF